ncbi:hypothetical protein A2853_00480 [Candidatus Kaiserbacteria bacterium RIFCSPHIGHO2_01_FULL_55_17]|uniref:histidine kinase n=1 Tax=Candidatus Kaiserbacteria bacterium RIFCSPHIGHO2_01_FULL_55_17 TaxID=1798484 RepID=A0A1F6D8Q7_9BACT|nr:MAG: hypothetical protein A2853_00480 [Candidatus Kaiserbacteria bacterium RIFCSPHIGHO2_01_FULL_55_17]
MDLNTCFATTDIYRNLALYSHLIPALASVVLGIFAYMRAADRQKAAYFFTFSIAFALWLVSDMLLWTQDSYYLVAAFWNSMDLIEVVFFLLLFGFVCIDLFPEREPMLLKPFIVIAALIPFIATLFGDTLNMQQAVCEMTESTFLSNYKLWLEMIVLAATFCIGVVRIAQVSSGWSERIRIALITLSVFLFMGVFAGTEYFATTTGIFEVNLYALFTLPVFVLSLTIAITSYGTFRLGDTAIKALFYVFLILAGTQFFFVNDMTGFLLAAMSFVVVLTLGIMLFRSNEREIAARHEIERQEKALEIANKQQEGLLHFISHEVKGYLTESEAGFASIAEGDWGETPPKLKEMSQNALASVRRGVRTVMEILDASNLKKGTVSYKKQSFDLKAAVLDIVEHLKRYADEKGLAINVSIGDGRYTMEGDEEKIRQHVIRNLIDNAIKYTPKGTIDVKLTDGAKLLFSVKDSGVGVTPEDMKNLFTEGGHGKDSLKVNVHSTGYGLYIAKQIVDAHGGKVWAESLGQGKGSTFIVEFPAT